MANKGARDKRRELRRRLEAKLEEIERKVQRTMPGEHGIRIGDPTVLDRALEPRPLLASLSLPPEPARWLFLQEARLLHPEILEDLYQDVFRRPRGEDQTEALLDWLEKYWLLEAWIFSESQQTLCWWEARKAWDRTETRGPRLPAKVRLRWGFELEIASDRAARIKAARIDRLYQAGAEPSMADLLHVALKGTYTLEFDPPRTITWQRAKESPEDLASRIEGAAEQLKKVARLLRAQARNIDSYSAFRHFKKIATRQHYRWLVEKQIEGRSYRQLSRGPGQTFEAARNATQRLAERIAITLRPAV